MQGGLSPACKIERNVNNLGNLEYLSNDTYLSVCKAYLYEYNSE